MKIRTAVVLFITLHLMLMEQVRIAFLYYEKTND